LSVPFIFVAFRSLYLLASANKGLLGKNSG
jgi:hypothetical protein